MISPMSFTAALKRSSHCLVVAGGSDGDEGGETEVELRRIEQRHAAADDALFLKCLHPAPAGVARQVYPGGEVFDRQRGVALKFPQNLPVPVVHYGHSLSSWDKIPLNDAIRKWIGSNSRA